MMDNSARAWELAMALIASGKIPFDPSNKGVSVHILARHLQELQDALQSVDVSDAPPVREGP
ncbi:hypothetical protein [Pseudomonas yamanorum]|uniref:hypothetical protein n=1 Tax=Pseudomonas yamanorum TaxID=515393 RepID=UPI003D365756